MTTEKFLELTNDEDFREIFRQMDNERKVLNANMTLHEYLTGKRRKLLELAADYRNSLKQYIKILAGTNVDKNLRKQAIKGLKNREAIFRAEEFVDSDIYCDLISIAKIYDDCQTV